MPHPSKTHVQECITDCFDCHRVCLETLQHCLKMGGKHAEASHIGLLQTCAVICESGAQFMISESPFQSKVCEACADVCLRCAESCESIGGGDSQMARCAEICRKCAESCRRMSGGGAKAA